MNVTPKKVHVRSTPSCYLCKNQFSAKHLTNIFRKDDSLLTKINVLCGINIREDGPVKTICRNCRTKLNKYWEFRSECIAKEQESGNNENTLVTKRGIFSPNQNQPNKKIHIDDESSTKKKLMFEKETVITTPDIFQEINKNCEFVCTRIKNKSVLHNHTFNGMGDFSFEQIFKELQTRNPVLIKIFDAITAKNGAVDDSVQVKYALVYAILMNARWHELTLLQRVIAILAIEGGCSTKVSIINLS